MAYLPNIGQAILFGGASSAERGFLGDSWIWQAGCWTRQQVSSAPSAREAMAMAYDSVRKVVVAFGGRTDPSLAVFSSETWLWDGQTWSSTTKGPVLGFTWSAFDENIQQVLLYGEANGGVGQTWTWDGTGWHQVVGQSPPGRSGTGMAFDASSRRVILFGGLDDQTKTLLNDTWAWNGSAWQKLAPAHSPSPRQVFAMASFTAQKQIVLVGGVGRGVSTDDAWIWNGSDWSQMTGIGARGEAAAIDVGSAVVLFGGNDHNGQRNDVTLWNGSTWASS